ncbi:hypothetical protein D8T43_22515 [Vibrio vulnificus]|nr:hypothetical protein D8T43_22515 [Vibrio vulnificus]
MSFSKHVKNSVGKGGINSKLKPWVWQLTKHSRGIHNARQFWFELALVFTAQWFRLGGRVVHPLMRRYVFFQHQRIYWCWSLERQRQF